VSQMLTGGRDGERPSKLPTGLPESPTAPD
jgi:hypothetical protein